MRAPPTDARVQSVPPGKRSIPPEAGPEPAVLVVGASTGFVTALADALVRHSVFVGTTGKDDVLKAVVAAAPDLILLVDDAARDCGREVIEHLATSPLSSVVPVAILDDDARLESRLEAFRHGAAAVVRRSASIDAIATEIARLVREIPERRSRGLGQIGEVTLEELVATLARELRSGILSVRSKGTSDTGSMRLVLGGGRPVSAVIDEFVKRMGSHVIAAEPLEYEFDERAGGTVKLFDPDSLAQQPGELEVGGLRVLLADDDTARADAIAQELRRLGAVVGVTDVAPNELRFARLRELDPGVLLIGQRQIQGPGYGFVQRMRADVRLRWASLLVVDWRQIWPEDTAVPSVEGLLAMLHGMAEPARALRQRMEQEPRFETRLETMGPARLVRVLAETKQALRAVVHNPRAMVQIDLSDGLVVGALADVLIGDQRTLEGPAALAALMGLSAGRVRVERVEQPAAANLMATPDVALNLADGESPPIPPSIPAPESQGQPATPVKVPPSSSLARTLLIALATVLALFVLVGGALAILMLRRPVEAGPSGAPATAARPSAPASVARPSAVPVRPVPSTPAASAAPSSSIPSVATPVPVASAEIAAAGVEAPEACAAIANPTGGEGEEIKNANRAIVRGDLAEAERWYCAAVGRTPNDKDAVLALTRLLLGRGDGKGALTMADRALSLAPDEARAHMFKGDALALTGDPLNARRSWARAYEFSPDDERAMLAVGKREMALGSKAADQRRYADASRFLLRASTLDPKSHEAALALAGALLGAGQPERALRWARRASELNPRSFGALIVLAEALERSGDKEGARKALTRAVELQPNNREARVRLSRLGK